MSYKRNLIWFYFMEIDENYAMCKICKNIYSRPGLSPLKRHLRVKHPDKFEEYCKSDDSEKLHNLAKTKCINHTNDEVDAAGSTTAVDIQDERSLKKTLKKLFKKKSQNDCLIWNYFRELDADFAMCNICKNIYTRRGQNTTDLKKHLNSAHPEKFEEYTKQELDGEESDASSTTKAENDVEEIEQSSKRSLVWKYFKEKDKDSALCKICEKIRARRGGSTSSLRAHLKRMHPTEYKELCGIESEEKYDEICPTKPKRSRKNKHFENAIEDDIKDEIETVQTVNTQFYEAECLDESTDPLVPSPKDFEEYRKLKVTEKSLLS